MKRMLGILSLAAACLPLTYPSVRPSVPARLMKSSNTSMDCRAAFSAKVSSTKRPHSSAANPTSSTNFVLVRVPDGPAMVKALHDADICVRSYKAANLKNCLRITITTDEVVRKVVAVMTEEAKKNA